MSQVSLVEMMVELDRLFDERAGDGMEPVYALVDGKLVAICGMTCEFEQEKGRRVVILKGEVQ